MNRSKKLEFMPIDIGTRNEAQLSKHEKDEK